MPVSITFVGSTPYVIDDFHLRQALVGATLSRAWASVVQATVRYVVSFDHESSRANPVLWETSLSGASHGFATLTAGARTGAEAAAAWQTAAELLGMTGIVRLGATLTIAGASSFLSGSAMVYDPTQRGIWGMQRSRFGTATTPNQLGDMGGTGTVHVTSPNAVGRILGVYMRTGGAAAVRLGIANGPAYSTTPTAFSAGVEGTSTNNGGLRLLRLAEPMAMTAAQHKWISFRGAAGGNPQLSYRAHGSTPVGSGDLQVGEQLLFSSTEANPATAIYTAGAYTHSGGPGPYGIYAFVGFVYELRDAQGHYPGDGGFELEVGTHTTATAGSPTATVATAMDAETFGMRHPVPWDCNVTSVMVSIAGHAADEDLGLCFYNFGDVVAPSVAGATLMRDEGRFGVAGTGYQTHAMSSPLAVTAGTILGVYFNAGNLDGTTPTDTISVYYDPDTSAAEYWSTAWIDDGRTWNDMDPVGGGGYGQLTEYRTQAILGGDMPEGDPTPTWPPTFLVDASDDNSIRNHLRHRVHLSRSGLTGLATSSGGGGRALSPTLWSD